MNKYLPSIVALSVTLLSVLVTLTSELGGGTFGVYGFLIVGAGAGVSLLLFLVAFVDGKAKSVVPSLGLGGVAVPVIVIIAGTVLFVPLLMLAEVVMDWIERSGVDLGRSIEPWVLALLVELAILAPLIEEFTKPLAAIVAKPKTRRDAFLFGAAAGIGFAIMENFLYAAAGGFGYSWLPIAVTRMVSVGLHPFGAALISVAIFERRNIVRSYGLAVGAHALWNGAIAVTLVAYDDNGLASDGYLWGVAMFGMLTVIGTVILLALVTVATAVRDDRPVRSLGVVDRLARPEGIGALALISTVIAIPFAIAMYAFPIFLSL